MCRWLPGSGSWGRAAKTLCGWRPLFQGQPRTNGQVPSPSPFQEGGLGAGGEGRGGPGSPGVDPGAAPPRGAASRAGGGSPPLHPRRPQSSPPLPARSPRAETAGTKWRQEATPRPGSPAGSASEPARGRQPRRAARVAPARLLSLPRACSLVCKTQVVRLKRDKAL